MFNAEVKLPVFTTKDAKNHLWLDSPNNMDSSEAVQPRDRPFPPLASSLIAAFLIVMLYLVNRPQEKQVGAGV